MKRFKSIFVAGAIFSLMIAMVSVIGCSPTVDTTTTNPGDTTTTTTVFVVQGTITIYFATTTNTTDLYESSEGLTNDVYIVGSLGSSRNVANSLLVPSWNPASPNGLCTFISNAVIGGNSVSLYKIVLEYSNTTDFSTGFKFVNGTPTFGGDWANEEMKRKATDDGLDGIGGNRTFDVAASAGTNIVVFLTNQKMTPDYCDLDANDGVGSAILFWKGVTSTLKCIDFDLTLTFSDAVGSTGYDANNMVLYGNFNSWSSAFATNGMTGVTWTVSGSTLTINIPSYSGPVSLDYQLRYDDGGTTKYGDTGPANYTASILKSTANGGSTNIIKATTSWH